MTVDDVIAPLSGPASRSPVWTRTRLVGKPLRAAAFALVGLVVLAGALAVVVISGRGRPLPNVWTWSAILLLVPGAACIAIAVDEIRRPLRRVGSRTFGRGVGGDGGAPWSPYIPNVVDEYRRTTQLNPARPVGPLTLAVEAVREHFSPRVRSRLSFDDAPLRRGAVARMTFTAAPERGTVDGTLARFHLRCFAESPDVILPWRGGIRCLADLTPVRRRDSGDSPFAADLEFGIPARLPGSDLAAPEPRYWILSVSIGGLDGPYREEFFVPVAEARLTT